jgi:hypothetical protein
MDKLPNPDLLTEFAKKHPNYHVTHVNGQKIPEPLYECDKWYRIVPKLAELTFGHYGTRVRCQK